MNSRSDVVRQCYRPSTLAACIADIEATIEECTPSTLSAELELAMLRSALETIVGELEAMNLVAFERSQL